jgi:hypothetical protein
MSARPRRCNACAKGIMSAGEAAAGSPTRPRQPLGATVARIYHSMKFLHMRGVRRERRVFVPERFDLL